MRKRKKPKWAEIDHVLLLALQEDLGAGDVTTNTLIPEQVRAKAYFVAREPGIVAGLELVRRLYLALDRRVRVKRLADDGDKMHAGQRLAEVSGPARAILAGERTALNFLQRMCGVATMTRRYVDAVKGLEVKIYDTRKTMPGLRVLDKLAVLTGGGENHRHGLYDMVLIKDNHLQLVWPGGQESSIAGAISRAKMLTDVPVMVEVDTLEQLREALEAEPDMVLLDNMDCEMLALAVEITRKKYAEKKRRRPLLEASGGVSLASVRSIAKTGVDRISIGALTHSAAALDIALDIYGRNAKD